MPKGVYGLKHGTVRMNHVHMNYVMNWKEQLAEHQAHYQEPTCPRCGKPRGVRPLWMVGKYAECLACYEEMQANGETPRDISVAESGPDA